MNNIQKYIKSRNLSGGQALLAKQYLEQGKTPEIVDNLLFNIGDEDVSEMFRTDAEKRKQYYEYSARAATESNTNHPDNKIPVEYIKSWQDKARYIANGLRKIFPSGKERK